jgi:hypothetical protein
MIPVFSVALVVAQIRTIFESSSTISDSYPLGILSICVSDWDIERAEDHRRRA